MTNVIAWPPVGLTAWELTKHHPTSSSPNVFGGPDRVSSAGKPRYLATATITGIGADQAGAGYVEMLKDQLQGRRHLVRIPSMAPLWHLHDRRRGKTALINQLLQWTAGGDDLLWTAGGNDLLWSTNREMYGEPTTDNGWPAVTVTGLPAGVVIRPSEFIVMRGADSEETRRVLTLAKADANGEATIRLDAAFTISGLVSIGERKNIVFQPQDVPREVQPVSGTWAFTWTFREVFASEYADAWTELDPWR